jgi:hypothetical protein
MLSDCLFGWYIVIVNNGISRIKVLKKQNNVENRNTGFISK